VANNCEAGAQLVAQGHNAIIDGIDPPTKKQRRNGWKEVGEPILARFGNVEIGDALVTKEKNAGQGVVGPTSTDCRRTTYRWNGQRVNKSPWARREGKL